MSKHDGRCSRRYATFDAAWKACDLEPECMGVARDNGLPCGLGRSRGSSTYELRGGNMQRGPGMVWVCAPRFQQQGGASSSGTVVAPTAQPNAAGAPEGFVFIVLGSCAMPNHDCKFVREVSDAIDALRAVFEGGLARRPIAVVSDGGIGTASLMRRLPGADLVVRIPQSELDGAARDLVGHSDHRVRKLLAYRQSPFERTVFLDGDTRVRTPAVGLLFDALDKFDLVTSFECCRVDYTSAGTAYDASGFFRGWEMQTGVMGYRRGSRLDAFWRETTREYTSHATLWNRKSSGEQGAATLALSRVDIRYLPLPPSFNARPFTMNTYVNTFGVPIYHGKELWKRTSLSGAPASAEAMIAERMLRDWDTTRDALAAQFRPEHLANVSASAAFRQRAFRGRFQRQQFQAARYVRSSLPRDGHGGQFHRQSRRWGAGN